jgi:hypothetical protein
MSATALAAMRATSSTVSTISGAVGPPTAKPRSAVSVLKLARSWWSSAWCSRAAMRGADGSEVTHYFDREDDARRMLQRMLDAVPAELSDWANMTQPKRR